MQVFGLALAPSLFWLWWFWSREHENREDLQALSRAFVLGAFFVIPTALIEFLFSGLSRNPSTLECFFLIGPVEELFKLLAVWLSVGKDRNFDEPADGIVYAAAAALGFAFAENLLYFISLNAGTFVLRSFISVPVHVLQSVPWAVALGRLRCDPSAPRRIIFSGFIVASLLHGSFDALCYQIHFKHDFVIVLLLLLTLLEWRLYALSMREMISLGRRLLTRRIFAGPACEFEEPVQEDFSWRWFVYSLLCSIAGLAIAFVFAGYLAPLLDKTARAHLSIISVSIMLTGLGIGLSYFSPGRTVRESAISVSLCGFAFSFLTGWPGDNALEVAAYFAFLGAFGSWIGETMQVDRPVSAPES